MKQYVITIFVATDKELTKKEVHEVNFGVFDKDVTDIQVEEIQDIKIP